MNPPQTYNPHDPNTTRDAPAAMSREEFRATAHELVDVITDLLWSVPERPVSPDESPEVVRALINGESSLPEIGMDARVLLRSTADMLFRHSLFNGHPSFFGYITASPTPIGILGDFLAAAVNANCGAWRLSPVATEIEAQTIRWLAEFVGYPVDGGGLLVSGGNMANTVGLFAARRAAADWDLRAAGVGAPDAAQLCIYTSAETHTWIQKAADLAGLGTDAIRWLPTDDGQRMDLDALREAIDKDRNAGRRPMMVIGAGGSVSTGAVDPLADMAAICREAGIWFHVDGAYGGFAAAVQGASTDLSALGLADSVALDPHKWLYAPLEAGAVLIRDSNRLRDAFAYHPPYYHFGQEALNYVDLGPQNSRGFRALKVWLALRQVGREGYVKMIGDDIRLSRQLAGLVEAHQDLELFTQNLSIATFRYVPVDLANNGGSESTRAYLNRLNETLLDRLQRSGEAFVSNAVVCGCYVLRACIVNFHTSEAAVAAVPALVVRLGREVDRELRPLFYR